MKVPPLIDLHEDVKFGMEYPEIFPENLRYQTSFSMLEESNVRLVVASSFIAPPGTDYSVDSTETNADELDWYEDEVRKRAHWGIVRNKGDLEHLFESDITEHGLLLHLEGLLEFDGNGEDWGNLETLYEKGMRSLGMMWNGQTPLGSGASAEGGLTPLGGDVLSWCQEKGVMADLAHMNEETFWDVAEMLSTPLVVSHVGARHFCDRPRNITDEQIRAVGESGGVVGIYMTQSLLCSTDETNVGIVIAHLEHVRDIAGINTVAIGSDFGGIDARRTIDNMTSVGGLAVLLEGMGERGWNDEEIEKVAWKNAVRVLTEILPEK